MLRAGCGVVSSLRAGLGLLPRHVRSASSRARLVGKHNNYRTLEVSLGELDSLAEGCARSEAVAAAIAEVARAIPEWRASGTRGVFLTVPSRWAATVPELLSLGFKLHHARGDVIVLDHWLDSTPSKLPAYAHHSLGCAGFVLDSERRVLVIRERVAPFAGMPSLWKLPGGAADAGEDIDAAAVREVREETGVETRFVSILAMRQMHKWTFGQSDLYVVCLLEPLTTQITHDRDEIAECAWMPLDDYAASELTPMNKRIAQAAAAGTLSSLRKHPYTWRGREHSVFIG